MKTEQRQPLLHEISTNPQDEQPLRIPRAEVTRLSGIIENQIKLRHPEAKISLTYSLEDKKDFGDLDFVIVSDRQPDQDDLVVHEVFGNKLLKYSRIKNDSIDHCVIEVEPGKSYKVDFIRAQDAADFDAKLIYYSKYPLSAALGTLAENLGFKYGNDGFYKRYIDSNKIHHDILITKDLKLAMEILGLDADQWEKLRTEQDLQKFIKSSDYYLPIVFIYPNVNRKRRAVIRKKPAQEEFYRQLSEEHVWVDPNLLQELQANCQRRFAENYPELDLSTIQQITAIENAIKMRQQARQARLKNTP